MKLIKVSENICRVPACEEPLSADIGVISGKEYLWLYDVGAIPENIKELQKSCRKARCVLSHFHPDHVFAASAFDGEIYLSPNTYKYVRRGNVVNGDLYIEDGLIFHIFTLPSSHSKGSLGLETGDFAFLGDGVYSTRKDGKSVYNATVLRDEILKLRSLDAKTFLLSHDPRYAVPKEEVIERLEEIYSRRKKEEAYIEVED